MIELYSITYYILIVFILIFGLIIYLKIAEKWSIIDQPNNRSSHSYNTKRGAGVLYLFGLAIYLFYAGFNNYILVVSTVLLGTIGFIDDIKNIHFKKKLLLQFIIIFSYLKFQNYLLLEWYFVLFILVLLISSINIYNFMDGINGLTILYSLSSLISFYFINSKITTFIDPNLLLIMILSNLILGIFNIRKKAICFVGDVGSMTMGFLYASLAILLMIKTNSLNPLILFVVYGIDAVWTILQRLVLRENIFLAHRKHLYQLLVNELGISHILVSSIYVSIQVLLNTIWMIFYPEEQSLILILSVFIILSIIYLFVKKVVLNKIKV
jgi:UDP-N-acetylmuramyl pentapeptide phosphotransferase/UDP-N-acetylglucosamine-1-phosphate transferase